MKGMGVALHQTNWYCETLDPRNPAGPRIRAILPHDLALRYYKMAPVRYENLRCVKWVLQHPERIFEGVREHNQGGWCYVGRPRGWHVRPGQFAPFPDRFVFAVYLNPKMVVYEWRAELRDQEDPLSPLGWADRYGGLKWKSTS